tara:strand:- start:38 stop:901 length:864 start_codon:yes stop_codon:yes gene_type:complete
MTQYTKLEFIDEPVYYHGFPWREISYDDITKDFVKLQNKLNNSAITVPLKSSYIGYNCTDKFFQYERLNTCSNTNMSCVEYWFKRKAKILQYWNKRNKNDDLFGTIVFLKRAPSHFSPHVAGMVYKYFKAKCVYDPYAGWGDRCLAAMALGIKYIGVDSNPNLENCYNNLINFFNIPNIKFISGKSENVLLNCNPDLIFSSPPFWTENQKILELYNNCEQNIDTFINKSIKVLFNRYLNKIPIALYINKYMYKKIKILAGKAKHKIDFSSGCSRKNNNPTPKTIYIW